MCLAHPARIVSINSDDTAIVELGETRKQISLALVSDVNIDDYVLIHVGYALSKLSLNEAKKTLKTMQELNLEN